MGVIGLERFERYVTLEPRIEGQIDLTRPPGHVIEESETDARGWSPESCWQASSPAALDHRRCSLLDRPLSERDPELPAHPRGAPRPESEGVAAPRLQSLLFDQENQLSGHELIARPVRELNGYAGIVPV